MEAAITPDLYTHLTTELTGFTTLYGKVLLLRESDSTVGFEPVDGRALYCPASKDIVLCLREQLYQHVVAHGLAVWDALTLEVIRFEIQEFEPFTAGAASESLAALREQFGSYFDQIDDVDDLGVCRPPRRHLMKLVCVDTQTVIWGVQTDVPVQPTLLE